VIGAGVAGLVAAIELARRGVAVTVVERGDAVGGKMRQVKIGAARLDAGPTVFTMRWVFDEIFAAAGTSLEEHIALRPAEILARHAWSGDQQLDLFADAERSADAIGRFAGPAAADGYRRFCVRAEKIYRTLEQPFLRSARPTAVSLVSSAGARGIGDFWRIDPFKTLWNALGEYFPDPRLRQLFGRYATYCGSSPFLAPATLMLVAHVERSGVWLVDGGMHKVAAALARVAIRLGAGIRCGAEARDIVVSNGRAVAVRLMNGDRLDADAVIANADVAAVTSGRLGADVVTAVPPIARAHRSLSAVTWNMVARTEGFALQHHNVFFSDDYPAEFDSIFRRARLPESPTVYVCAQDRDDRLAPDSRGPERLLCLVNAPPTGDVRPFERAEIEQCEQRMFRRLETCGLRVQRQSEATIVTTPAGFERLFPATGGALYGMVSHGWRATFRRPGSRTQIAALYLAGGGTHPGPGVPMAALSGRLAAASVIEDLASRGLSRPVAMPGGMSTR
jgi:1-hydroxycarotenoid 3,4-desaturase